MNPLSENVFRKHSAAFLILLCAALLCDLWLVWMPHTKPQTETAVRFETVERIGNIDTDGTLFIAPDGNLYAVDAQYPETGNEFLLKFDTKGTAAKTDDAILEVWAAPIAK